MKLSAIYISIACIAFSANMVQAQLVNTTPKANKASDWYNASFEKEGIFGAGVNQAYEFLKNKKPLKKPIVAIIGSGMDLSHDNLKGAAWSNLKEKENLKDDDSNGWIDDLRGWNFLGTKDGKSVENTGSQGDREYLRLKDKYSDLVFDGKKYLRYDSVKAEMIQVEAPKNMEEYHYFRNQVIPESKLAGLAGGKAAWQYTGIYVRKFDQELRQKFPHLSTLTTKEFATLYDPTASTDSLREVAHALTSIAFGVLKTENWDPVYKYILNNAIKGATQELALYYKKNDLNVRTYIGDNPLLIDQKNYGNNNLLTENSGLGTLCAGIIAASRGNTKGINGIAPGALVMPLQVSASVGDPYLKDVALAIRYAVDQKADVIMLEVSDTLYPKEQGQWLDEALEYAERKGVLVVMPVRDMSYNLEKTPFYPNRILSSGKRLSNLLTVAASNSKGNPLLTANYSKEMLDLFAPGEDVKSTFSGNTYREASGSLIGAATATGVAALIKSYYPNLSGSQLRTLILNNVTSRRGEEVEKSIRNMKEGKENGQVQDLYLFEDLCATAGIINAEKAIKAAANSQKTSK